MSDDSGLQSDWPTEPAGAPPPRRTPMRYARELPVLLAFAFGLALIMKTFLLQMFFIPSASMEPLLQKDDRVAVNKLAYRFREPRRGEVIVFIARKSEEERSFLTRVRSFLTEGLGVTTPPETDFIKRIIGLPGDTIEVTRRNVFVTPKGARRTKLVEPYIRLEGANFSTQEPFKVPKGQYFVMGDNRNNSSDSRSSLGTIKRESIIGKAFVKIWPPGRVELIDEPTYDIRQKKTPKKNRKKNAGTGERALRGPPQAGGARSSSALPVVAGVAMLAMLPAGRRRFRRRP